MNNSAQPFHVWIFNDASIVSLLRANSPLWPDFTPGILAELSTGPVLAHALNLTPPSAYPGFAALLGSNTTPSELAVRLPELSIPAILSPTKPLAPASAIAAIRRLRTDSRITGPRLLLLEAALACELLPSLASADRIGIAWEMSSPPGNELEIILAALESENLLRANTWAGLLGYFGTDHQATEEEKAAATATLAPLSFARMINI